ncbi:MAG: hypothetical protein JWO79_3435, partial [Actinomycetia bacterium]|nr:hypothetical protein [Actinomycetes bacterium]
MIPISAFGAVGVFALPAAAAAGPTAVCTMSSEIISSVTGISAVSDGYVVLNNAGSGNPLRLYKLDSACKATRILSDPNITVFSPQDLARTPDGTLWVGDIGDTQNERSVIVIDKIASGATKGARIRLKYPDGAHNAAAMVVQPDGIPVVFTWEASAAKIYTTAAAPPVGQTATTLQAAGVLTLPASTTDGGTLGPTSRKVVSGAAISPDGKKLVVRTLTDAYEWDINGTVAATLKSGVKPRVTPLPNESDGQSITYTTDGAGYVTVSTGKNAKLLSWSPAPLPEPSAATKAGTGPAATAAAPSRSLLSRLTLSQLNGMMLGAAAVGLLMLLGGIFGIVRFRRQLGSDDEPSLEEKLANSRRGPVNGVPQDQWDGDPPPPAGQTAFVPRVAGGQPQSATSVLAAEQQSGRGGTVYGGNPDSPRRSTVYGAPAEPGPPPAG